MLFVRLLAARVGLLLGLCLVLVGLTQASSAHAHALSPASLMLIEQGAGKYVLRFRRPEAAAPLLALGLPQGCQASAPTVRRVRDLREDTYTLECRSALTGQELSLRGLREANLGAIVYVEFASGERVRALLSPETPSFAVPSASSVFEVFADYLGLGMEHLLLGPDHLLFVLGLLFLVRRLKPLVFTLSAFTLGHSVTLCLLALNLVRVDAAAVEVGIALSLVALAASLLRQTRIGRAADNPVRALPWLAMLLGLLHGLGFAGALAETGLPEHQIPLSLLGFNLGIECAQLAVVWVVLGMQRVWPVLFNVPVQRVVAYAMGATAAMWCIERSLAWWG